MGLLHMVQLMYTIKYYLNHLEYEEIVFVFSPSIGISDIEFYTSDYLESWTEIYWWLDENNTGMIRQLILDFHFTD